MPYSSFSLFDDASRCPLTGASMVPEIMVPRDWRRPDDARSWQIWHSTALDFGQILPRPAPSDIAGFYDMADYYTHPERGGFDSSAESRAVGWLGRALASIAWRFEAGAEPTRDWWASILPPGATDGLEIGCGDGDRMRTFGPLLTHVRGVEPDPRAVAAARMRGLDVHEGIAEALPAAVQDRRYGLIVFAHVLEHTLDPVLSLRNAGALLDEDGVMSVEVPNNACEGRRRMGEAWRWTDAPRHLNFFTPESLVACAEKAGLRVKAVLFRGYVRQFLPDWIVDEARIRARLEGRGVCAADIARQVRHSAALLAATAMAAPERKYDSVRILCTR
jgi:SAM-dependent methyltransferase